MSENRMQKNGKFITFLILVCMYIRQNAWKRIISFLIVKQSVILKFYYYKTRKRRCALNIHSNTRSLTFAYRSKCT